MCFLALGLGGQPQIVASDLQFPTNLLTLGPEIHFRGDTPTMDNNPEHSTEYHPKCD